VVLLAGIREPLRAQVAQRHPVQDIKLGLQFVFQHPLLKPVFITQLIFGAAAFMIIAVFVPYAVRHLHLSATGVGVVLAMYGGGMVIGVPSGIDATMRDDPSAITCPVMCVAGWTDGYRDSALRLMEVLDVPRRALIGPWGHNDPVHGAPGPAIVELDEITRGHGMYSLHDPIHGLKAGVHHGGPEVDPNTEGAPDAESVAQVAAWVRDRLPDVDPEPLGAETCLYTSTADGSFVLERRGRTVIGSARVQVRARDRAAARGARARLRFGPCRSISASARFRASGTSSSARTGRSSPKR